MWNKKFDYLKDQILYQIFKIFQVYHKKNEAVSDNLSIEIYVNQIENRIKFKIRCYLELLTAEMMKLLENGKSKITKDKNGENIG